LKLEPGKTTEKEFKYTLTSQNYMSKSKEVNLKLSIEEANLIIEALGNLPFIKVYKLIEKIHLQANEKNQESGK